MLVGASEWATVILTWLLSLWMFVTSWSHNVRTPKCFAANAKLKRVSFNQLLQFPIASTPLSDEVARVLTEKYGAKAHPDQLIQLRCEEISSLLDVARNTQAVVLTVRAVAPDLKEVALTPSLNANARFGWVSLKSRSEAPLAKLLREAALQRLSAL
jgi:hypothetical protein